MATIKYVKFFCVSLSFLCLLPVTQAGPLPKAAKLLPPETILLVETADFQQLKGQFEKTSVYRLYKDPAMTAFVADMRAKFSEKIKSISSTEIFKTIVDANTLPQGRVAFALVPGALAANAQQPPFLFISQWGQHSSKIKEAVEKTVKKAVENRAYRTTEDYRTVTITTIIKELELKEAANIPNQADLTRKVKTNYCFIDDCLLVAADIDVLKFVIAHIKGAASSALADEPDYNTTMKTIGPDYDIELFINIKQIIKTILTQESTPAAQSTITNLGFDNVAALGSAIGVARRQQSPFTVKTFLKIDGAKRGIFKILDFQSAPFKIPRFIPSGTYSATVLNLDVKKTYTEFVNIVGSFSAQAAAAFYTPLPTSDSEDIPGLKIKDDIIDHLGSQIIVTQITNKPFSENISPAESLLAVESNNRTALEKSMGLLHNKILAPDNPRAHRELLGCTIYTLSTPRLPFFTPGMTPLQNTAVLGRQSPKLAFTITDTHLIFGTEPVVEKAIRTLNSAASSLVSNSVWFNKNRSAIPSVVGLVRMEDNSAAAELFWWMAKQTAKAEAKAAGSEDQQRLNRLISPELLPEFEAVRKYFGMQVFYAISRQDGFFSEFKNLAPFESTSQ